MTHVFAPDIIAKTRMPLEFIVPSWDAPANVRACVTTRAGGVSIGAYASFNLAAHVGDDPRHVAANRALLRAALDLPSEPAWLSQVHGTAIVDAQTAANAPDADGSIARAAGVVCAVLTADCLPVLLCDRAGTRVAALHAGWRGLVSGIIEAGVRQMGVAPAEILAWLGPAIGPAAFEVGDEVRAQFVACDAAASAAFQPRADRWLADIYLLARQRLQSLGVSAVFGGDFCTVSDARFYSFRRDKACGRIATLIWLDRR